MAGGFSVRGFCLWFRGSGGFSLLFVGISTYIMCTDTQYPSTRLIPNVIVRYGNMLYRRVGCVAMHFAKGAGLL